MLELNFHTHDDTPIKISVESLHSVSSENQNNFVLLRLEHRAAGNCNSLFLNIDYSRPDRRLKDKSS